MGSPYNTNACMYLSVVIAKDAGDVGPRKLQAQPFDQVERVDGVAHPLLSPTLTMYFIFVDKAENEMARINVTWDCHLDSGSPSTV